MLDAHVRPFIDPALNKIGRLLVPFVNANHITYLGLICAFVAMFTICFHEYMWAAVFIVLNRLCDGLDGAIARASKVSDFGGFLDICVDFITYAGIIGAFAWGDRENAVWAAFLLVCYVGCMTSFLAFAISAEKHGITTQHQGIKSFYYLGGLCEGTETAFVMLLLCAQPHWLPQVCIVYGIMCILTTIGRIISARILLSGR
jgi:phosphatidylglycerophosphate synthase